MNHDQYMQQAFKLAKTHVGLTFPNPVVGSVIVKGRRVIAEGLTQVDGVPHAEVDACSQASMKRLAGATMYVTMEPCSFTGKTLPCVDTILLNGISAVVIGMKDPNPKVNGEGARRLRKAGVAVSYIDTKSELYKEIRTLNQPFIKSVTKGLPFVTLKAGTSLDGKIATHTHISKWITSKQARSDARIERSMHDAVLVGSGTVQADDPELAAHGPFKKKKILRIIIDPELSTDVKSRVYRDRHVFVATTELATKKQQKKFDRVGITYKTFGKKRVSIKALLKHLNKIGVQSVFVEGGSGVHGSFHDAALKDLYIVDQVVLYMAPKIIGGKQAVSAIGGAGAKSLDDILTFGDVSIETIGSDIKIRGVLNTY